MSLGAIMIRIAFVLGLLALGGAVAWMRGNRTGERAFKWAYGGMTLALTAASILLMRAILTHDFRFDYVASYSSRGLELLYLVAAFWGGQEGTYLLWAFLAAVLGVSLYRKGSWQPASVMTAYLPTVLLLVLFMLNKGADPFRMSGMTPADGRGLNPLLKDPWMAIHPPIVFLGYAAMTIPAALAWVACFRKDETTWSRPALRWSIFGFLTLGVGIILGGVWSYKVLGWGGYWGWDPVENASLIPWIAGTALIHGLYVQRTTGALRLTNLAIAMIGYWLVIYSTFLTRSGILANFSVHSFAGGSIYGWLVGALAGVAAISVLALMVRRAPRGEPMQGGLAWPLVLSAVLVLFGISALLVLLGTSWPIISTWFGSPATPNISFYNQVNYPIYVVLLGLLSIAPFLGWKPGGNSRWLPRVSVSVILAAAATAAAIMAGGRGAGALVLFFVAAVAVFANLIRLFDVLRSGPLYTGAALTHLGFACMFLGIVTSGYWDRSDYYSLPLGQPVPAMDHVLTYEGHVEGSEPEYEWAVQVASGNGSVNEARLTMYELANGQLFRKPAILRRISGDLYIEPASLEFGDGPGNVLELTKNEPFDYQGAALTFLRFQTGTTGEGDSPMGGTGHGMTVEAVVKIEANGQEETVSLPLQMSNGRMDGEPVTPALLGVPLTLKGMMVEQGMIRVQADDGSEPKSEVLIVEASIKPMIGLLWAGVFLLGLGTLIAFIRRSVEKQAARAGSKGPR